MASRVCPPLIWPTAAPRRELRTSLQTFSGTSKPVADRSAWTSSSRYRRSSTSHRWCSCCRPAQALRSRLRLQLRRPRAGLPHGSAGTSHSQPAGSLTNREPPSGPLPSHTAMLVISPHASDGYHPPAKTQTPTPIATLFTSSSMTWLLTTARARNASLRISESDSASKRNRLTIHLLRPRCPSLPEPEVRRRFYGASRRWPPDDSGSGGASRNHPNPLTATAPCPGMAVPS